MEKQEQYLWKMLTVLEPYWDECRQQAEQARTYGDEETFRQWRVRLGAVTRSTLCVLNAYREVYGSHPARLLETVDGFVAKMRTETSLR